MVDPFIQASLKHHLPSPELTGNQKQAEAQLPMDAETQAIEVNMFQLVLGVFQQHEMGGAETVAGIS